MSDKTPAKLVPFKELKEGQHYVYVTVPGQINPKEEDTGNGTMLKREEWTKFDDIIAVEHRVMREIESITSHLGLPLREWKGLEGENMTPRDAVEEKHEQEDQWMKEGRRARIAECELTDNPYNKGTLQHSQWEAGWDFQDFEMLSTDGDKGGE